jgi:hypothetical protein
VTGHDFIVGLAWRSRIFNFQSHRGVEIPASHNIFDLLGSVLSQIQAPQGSGDPSKSFHHSIEPNRAGKMRIFFLLIDVATKEGFTGGVK